MSNLITVTYNDQRVLTTKQLADIYEIETTLLIKNFQRNTEHFTEGVHYYLLKGEALKEFKSERCLKLPPEIFTFLKSLQEFYDEESERLLDAWCGSDNEFVFKNHKGGEPLSPQTPLWWLKNFCETEGMRKVNIHSFRHLNASLLISNGVDVKTVQTCLGHTQASTTMNIYAHSFMEAQAKASEAVANSFAFTKTREQSKNQA